MNFDKLIIIILIIIILYLLFNTCKSTKIIDPAIINPAFIGY